jgi:predicted lipoprotein with Yx(FWY)xxD motif
MTGLAGKLAPSLALASSIFALYSTTTLAADKVLTDENGMTLYVFDKDGKNKSNCYDNCAKAWPPYKVPAGAAAKKDWTIVERKDGTKMWAYDDKPVYTYIKDTKKGDITGDGVGGVWHVAKEE